MSFKKLSTKHSYYPKSYFFEAKHLKVHVTKTAAGTFRIKASAVILTCPVWKLQTC